MSSSLLRIYLYWQLKFLAGIAMLLVFLPVRAQFTQTCIEPSRVQPYYMCSDPFYNPVCGCDNKTYRNQCDARNVHGVNLWTSGVCSTSGLDVDMYPNPVLSYEPLTVNLSYPDYVMGNADIKIVDMYGKVWEQRLLLNFNRTQFQFDMSVLKTGVYLLVVQSSSKSGVVKKFAKY